MYDTVPENSDTVTR